ncbi:3-dehydroquinate synthase family protein, partial [Xanthomonas fragariae]|uniref:3-dehydroquinate synthase family protein n=1 Tax=Xanthomonas fragariae TaxID=48664 RepID=UPI003CCE9E9D
MIGFQAEVGDPLFFQWLHAERRALLDSDAAALAQAIARSCEHKAEIVARDPLEKGERGDRSAEVV